MGYWTDRDQDGPPKSSEGWHRYKIVKAIRGTGAGRTFASQSGDPQLLVVFQDEEGAEASTMLTLSDKASWVMARLLSRAGVDLEELDRDGVDLRHFEEERYASEYLTGLEVWGQCTHESGKDGKIYTKLAFFHEAEVPPSALSKGRAPGASRAAAGTFGDGSPVPDDDDIPF